MDEIDEIQQARHEARKLKVMEKFEQQRRALTDAELMEHNPFEQARSKLTTEEQVVFDEIMKGIRREVERMRQGIPPMSEMDEIKEARRVARESAIMERFMQQVRLYKRAGLAEDEAVHQAYSELKTEEQEIFERMFEETDREVERMRRGEPPRPR